MKASILYKGRCDIFWQIILTNNNFVVNGQEKFKEAMVHKAPYTSRWQTYLDAYYGDYFKNTNLPDFKSNMVSNYIYSVIETIRPLMLDNDPAFQAIPRQPQATEFSNDLQEAFL